MTTVAQTPESRIRSVRGHKVMLDEDLAQLYGVSTKVLVQAVRRNPARFPPDFIFSLTKQETAILRSQIVTSRSSLRNWGGRRTAPYAFTEQGVAMLSSVLRSERAVQANVEIMRAFVRLRGLALQNAELARRLDALESKYDRQFKVVFDAIRELMAPLSPPKRRIGFVSG
ncbi:MAG: ORF6N domain-containing protein [Burkholderiales bacterium]